MSPLGCLLFLASLAHAWTADEPWRTVETDHYRIHYPLDTEAWALVLAARIDPMRERVAAVVGWTPDRPTDIVVLDPWSRANGFALPFSRGPRIGVFPTAAPASSGIGNYRLWAEDLLVHEDAHVQHLGRPSRNPVEHLLFDRVLGMPAIAVKSPAWVVEGYATLVEGILTGAGRPNSDGRATFLRVLAAEGQLPTYAQLDGSDRWRGGSMRYLVGSAYLEWLVARHGSERLPELWARMTARELRSFGVAFQQTFGAPPAELYGRFVAELSAGALAVEPAPDATEPFLDLDGTVSPPAVSPDGTLLATVERNDAGRSTLVVRAVEVDAEAVAERAEALARRLERDPLDVAPLPSPTQPHATVATLDDPLRRPATPRWLDADHLLFSAWVADSHGVLQPDLFTWSLSSGRTRRLTRAANLREAEPCGDFAVAVRRQHGLSHLVRVDLDSGATQPLTAPSPTVVDAGPRLDARCETVAWLRQDQTWTLRVAPLDALDGSPPDDGSIVPLPPGGQLLSVDLHPDGTHVTAAIGTAGAIDLWDRAVRPDAPWHRRTTQLGGAFDPEVAPSGDVYFLTTDAEGFDVVRLPADAPALVVHDPATARAWTQGVVRPPPVTDAPALPEGTAPPAAPYGLGPQQRRLLVSAQSTREHAAVVGGLVVGDLVGRSELVLLAGADRTPKGDDDAPVPLLESAGARASWTHRRFAVHTTVDAWWLGFASSALGGGATAHLHRRWATGRLDARLGGFGETRTDTVAAATTGRLHLRQHASVGPVVAGVGVDARGRARLASDDPHLGTAAAEVHLGQPLWSVEGHGAWAGAAGGAVAVGDVAPDLLAEVRTLGTAWWPELARSLPADATTLRRVRADLRTLERRVGVFGARAWSTCGADACGGPATVVGTDLAIGSGAQPLVTVPAATARAGVSCMLSRPDGTLDPSAFARGAAYAAWIAVQLEPGRPPAYPRDAGR